MSKNVNEQAYNEVEISGKVISVAFGEGMTKN